MKVDVDVETLLKLTSTLHSKATALSRDIRRSEDPEKYARMQRLSNFQYSAVLHFIAEKIASCLTACNPNEQAAVHAYSMKYYVPAHVQKEWGKSISKMPDKAVHAQKGE